ncbi:U3 small nucleolar RNA-associated protein [Verticillium dahliae VdLs.17]|uniref:U3 small nucleolar RNA-associated protein n=1 Tax=Verticillium dahliae (strain VdLs.17 / ATCC MYA-4575 / FGSC 10137) TaxID=498257 RepID=G2WRC1_VERDV|nr:U3 small nucleolar RNA-associated protein [Verticillium dahliae VdLs.17]EGY13422.1 U3 small nucleolar RNA-associated protein [Verticillium dahliae VdLs.17]
MAAPVGPLTQIKLPSGPSPVTAEQRYWQSFKNQLQIPSPTTYPITHISGASNDGHFAVTTGTRVQIYSVRTRKLEKTVTRFADVARSGDIRRDGKVLVAGEDTGRIQVFDVNSRAILKTWMNHKQPVWATRFSKTQLTTLLSASDDKTVRLWDLPSNQPTHTFIGHQDYVRSADFMPGSLANLLVSGSYDSTVRLWDPRIGSNQAVMTFKHAAPVEDVLALPSGTTLLAAAGPAISVLDLVAARPLQQLTNHQKTVTSLCLASGGTRLASGGLDGHVKIFETTGWNVVSTTKYSSPILTLRVLGASDSSTSTASAAGADPGSNAGNDRHLLVGMQSGVLSIRTRLSGAEATRQRDRDPRPRRSAASPPRAASTWPASRPTSSSPTRPREGARKNEALWQRALRQGRYAEALDRLLDPASVASNSAAAAKNKQGGSKAAAAAAANKKQADQPAAPLEVLTLLLALRHRSAVRAALEGRDERTVQPILKWVCAHVVDPRYVSACVEVGMHLIELYAEYAGGSADLADGFRLLRRRVGGEVEKAKAACETGGMVDGLILGAA